MGGHCHRPRLSRNGDVGVAFRRRRSAHFANATVNPKVQSAIDVAAMCKMAALCGSAPFVSAKPARFKNRTCQ